jgi:hypothetical protein
VVVIGGGLLVIAGIALAVFLSKPTESPRISISDAARSERILNGPYVGSRACRECHPGEYALYTRSGHSRTLRAAAQAPVAQRLNGRTVADPEDAAVTWNYALRDGRFTVQRAERGKGDRLDIEYAFGSDHHATTFVTVIDLAKPRALEHRLTHYSQGDSLWITPGQRAANPSPGTTSRGRELSPDETLKCFRCHATRMSAEGERELDASAMLPNVTCERCHGPARSHVTAARAGRTDLTMPYGIDRWTAESQLWLCGQCHRNPSRAEPSQIQPDNPALARFQPIGLQQSKCYTQSVGALSCVNCHDPHARASTDRASYERACLKCHETAPQPICRVSPGSGCIDCHMPRADSGQHILFTDHWIRVHPP